MNSNYKINHDVYTIANLVQVYAPHIEKLFNYINGKINTLNNCVYFPAMFSPCNFACFKYPNYVTVYIGSLIDVFYENENSFNDIMSAAAVCIAHELYHADQSVDAGLYKQSADYCTNIELAAEYNAEIFCQSHVADFKKYLGFDYGFGVESKVGTYTKLDESYIEKFILGTFRSQRLTDELSILLRENDNVAINISFNGMNRGFFAKYKGQIEVSEDAIRSLTATLGKFRPGISTYSYVANLWTSDGSFKEIGVDNIKVYNIEITEMLCNPFDIN